jgi:hypothetical protein
MEIGYRYGEESDYAAYKWEEARARQAWKEAAERAWAEAEAWERGRACVLCGGSGWTDHGRCEPCKGTGVRK